MVLSLHCYVITHNSLFHCGSAFSSGCEMKFRRHSSPHGSAISLKMILISISTKKSDNAVSAIAISSLIANLKSSTITIRKNLWQKKKLSTVLSVSSQIKQRIRIRHFHNINKVVKYRRSFYWFTFNINSRCHVQRNSRELSQVNVIIRALIAVARIPTWIVWLYLLKDSFECRDLWLLYLANRKKTFLQMAP